VSWQPQFTITPALLAWVEQIAAVRERILAVRSRPKHFDVHRIAALEPVITCEEHIRC
jgi:hypothetical protein